METMADSGNENRGSSSTDVVKQKNSDANPDNKLLISLVTENQKILLRQSQETSEMCKAVMTMCTTVTAALTQSVADLSKSSKEQTAILGSIARRFDGDSGKGKKRKHDEAVGGDALLDCLNRGIVVMPRRRPELNTESNRVKNVFDIAKELQVDEHGGLVVTPIVSLPGISDEDLASPYGDKPEGFPDVKIGLILATMRSLNADKFPVGRFVLYYPYMVFPRGALRMSLPCLVQTGKYVVYLTEGHRDPVREKVAVMEPNNRAYQGMGLRPSVRRLLMWDD